MAVYAIPANKPFIITKKPEGLGKEKCLAEETEKMFIEAFKEVSEDGVESYIIPSLDKRTQELIRKQILAINVLA